jgi:hypothetical protein
MISRWQKDCLAKLHQWHWQWIHGNLPRNLSLLTLPNAGLLPCIWVDPAKLMLKCKLETKSVYSGLLFQDGDWDVLRKNMQQQELADARYITCGELLIDQIPAEQTSEFKRMLTQLEAGQKPRGFASKAQVLNYLSDLSAMYKVVQAQGRLQTQAELGKATWGGEINCVVGRDGELLKTTDGNHRFAVARVLNLKSIPVQVSRIHSNLLPSIEGIDARSGTQAVNQFLLELQARYS